MARDYSRMSGDFSSSPLEKTPDVVPRGARNDSQLSLSASGQKRSGQASLVVLLREGEATLRGGNGKAAGMAGSSMRNVAPPSGRL